MRGRLPPFRGSPLSGHRVFRRCYRTLTCFDLVCWLRLEAAPVVLRRVGRAEQPPALMVWGRHDVFFDLAETLSWMQDLPRMEAHVLDGGHLPLETHAAEAGALIKDFLNVSLSSSRAEPPTPEREGSAE